MSMLALFELDTAEDEWIPIIPPRWQEPETSTPAEAKAAWKAWASLWQACRDCGTTSKLNNGHGSALICDDCAELDGAYVAAHHAARCDPTPQVWGWTNVVAACLECSWDQWSDELVGPGPGIVTARSDAAIDAAIIDHNAPRWRSRWGCYPYELDQHEAKVRAQARRRASYLKSHSSSTSTQGDQS